MKISTVVTVQCDLCGSTWTRTDKSAHELPGMFFTGASSYLGGATPDYCDECVQAVQSAIDSAKESRRALRP